MNLIKDIRKRLKIKKSILQLEFKRGERSKERELEKAAKEEAEAHRKLMASLRERQATTLSDLQSDCDREIARARKAELSAIQKSEETKKVYEAEYKRRGIPFKKSPKMIHRKSTLKKTT